MKLRKIDRTKVLRLRRRGIRSARTITSRLGVPKTREHQLEVQKILLAAGYPHRRRWTKKEMELVRKLYPTTTAATIARKLLSQVDVLFEEEPGARLQSPITCRISLPIDQRSYEPGEVYRFRIRR